MKVSLFAERRAVPGLLLAGMLLAPVAAAAELPPGAVGKLEGRVAISVAYAPDGKLLATGGHFHIELWDAASGKRIREMTGPDAPVYSVAFSPDGKTLASGGGDHIVRLWDVANGSEIRQFKGHSEEVRSVCFSPDGKLLASGSGDKTARFWEVSTGKEFKELWTLDEKNWVFSVAFSPNGKLLAVSSMNAAIRLYDTTSGQVVRTLAGHKMLVYSVAFSPDGRTLASSSDDKTVRLWDVTTGKEQCVLKELNAPGYHVAFSPDGRSLSAMSTDGEIALWEVISQQHIRTLTGAKSLVRSTFAFSGDGKTIAAGGGFSTVLFWDRTGRKGAARAVPSNRDLASLGSALAGSDAAKADEAIWTLVGAPDQAVSSLSEWLKPAVFDWKKVARLITDLDSDEFALREQASEELAKMGAAAEQALQRGLENNPSLEVKQRVESLLSKLERSVASPEVCRQVRAVAVLEQIGTKESRELLTKLAGGAEGDRLTQEAKEALRRMGQQSKEPRNTGREQ